MHSILPTTEYMYQHLLKEMKMLSEYVKLYEITPIKDIYTELYGAGLRDINPVKQAAGVVSECRKDSITILYDCEEQYTTLFQHMYALGNRKYPQIVVDKLLDKSINIALLKAELTHELKLYKNKFAS